MSKCVKRLVKPYSRATTATVLTKMKRGGVGSLDSSAKLIRFRTPATFGSNDERPKLKSTLQPGEEVDRQFGNDVHSLPLTDV